MFCCKTSTPSEKFPESGEIEKNKTKDENFNSGKQKELTLNPEEQKTLLGIPSPLDYKKKRPSMIRVATENNFQDTAMDVASSEYKFTNTTLIDNQAS